MFLSLIWQISLLLVALVLLRSVEANHFIGAYLRADLTDSATGSPTLAFSWSLTMVTGMTHIASYMTVCASGTSCPKGSPWIELISSATTTSTVCQLSLETDTGSNSNFYIPAAQISNSMLINTGNYLKVINSKCTEVPLVLIKV